MTDGSDTFAIFKYADGMIEWTSGDLQAGLGGQEAQVGFNSGDGTTFVRVPGSLTTSIRNIANTSNVGIPGQWVARISSVTVTLAGTVHAC